MKKILLSAVVAVSLTASAEVLTPAQALMRVEQTAEFSGSPAIRRMAAKNAMAAMPMRTVSSAAGVPQLYLFADGDGGLMILSAESEAEALIGYTDSYSSGQTIPPAMEYMLDCYAAEIEALRAGVVTYSSDHVFDINSPAISPICTTRWDQGAPYNNMCPTLDGQRCVTGCVATAMAQVLKTYEYPDRCSGGSFSYFWGNNNSTLSMNFNDVALDWDEMGDSYTASESAPAVAELMKAVGYAAQMGYSPYASGTHSYLMAAGLVRNFGYDCILSHELREWYPLGKWQQMVYDVIASGYAVYYDGANPDNTAAHAFVVDGYRGDGLFHLNWGWGGMSDGYFRLTALDPSAQGIGGSTAGYDRGQGAIFNLVPGATTELSKAPLNFFMITGFRAAKTSNNLNANVSFRAQSSGAIYNNGAYTVPKVKSAVKFVKSTGETFYFNGGDTYSNVGQYSGFMYSFSCFISDELTEGTYMVYPAVYNPTTEEYFDVRCPVGIGASFAAEVSGTKITFSTAEKSTLTAEELTVPATIHQNTPFEISAKLTNSTSVDYHGPVVAQLYKTGSSTVAATLGTIIISAAPSETVAMAAYFKVDANAAEVGEYEVALVDQNGTVISDRVVVALETEAPRGTPACKSIRATNKEQDQLTFRLSLTCSGGFYVSPIYVVLTEYGKRDILAYLASPVISLDPNAGATTVEFTSNFVDGVPGVRYTARPYYIYDVSTNTIAPMQGGSISFTLEETSAIDEVENAASEPVEYFDLGGRRVVNPQKGIYIRKQGSEVTKVVL